MSQSDERSGHRSDTGRAEAFSDAVLAIVITLLVLDLQPPEHRPGQLLTALLDQWPTYLAYLTSFLYVGVVWLNHKAAFNRISQMDRGLHWANLAILLGALTGSTPERALEGVHGASGLKAAVADALVETLAPIQKLYLVVDDIGAARDELTSRGADVSKIFHRTPNGFDAGPDPDGNSYNSFATFKDPDGNEWLLQQITERLPGRV